MAPSKRTLMAAASVGALAQPASAGCSFGQFVAPRPQKPLQPQDYNGLPMPDTCFPGGGPHHVYVIGDWGGLVADAEGVPPIPADKRSKQFPPKFQRPMLYGVDDMAQTKIAGHMRHRAARAPPDYILNVGDNFYWGGVEGRCGAPKGDKQWNRGFEAVYWGPGIDGKPWLGVLGNHDYGGYQFQSAWEDNIFHTWSGSPSNRWFTPALYYSSKVWYHGFSIDYYFLDSNVFDVFSPDILPMHNICGRMHNGDSASCPQGPHSLEECQTWFETVWRDQMLWLEERLEKSSATWQAIVTHFPAYWRGGRNWACFAQRYGIDLHISGHVHSQNLIGPYDGDNVLRGTTNLVSGGGGGITSEKGADPYGFDDQYGFMHMELSADTIKISAISHTGITRKTVVQHQRQGTFSGPKCANPELEFMVPTADDISATQRRRLQGLGMPVVKEEEVPKRRRLQGHLDQDHQCLGVGGSRSESDFKKVPAPTLEECEHACLATLECQGIEFGPNATCKTWVAPIKDTVPAAGVTCIPADHLNLDYSHLVRGGDGHDVLHV